MSMDIRTSTDKRVVPNAVLIRLREELGWGRPRLAKQFEVVGRRHGISTPEPAAMEKQIYRLETGRTLRPTPLYSKLYCLTFDRTTLGYVTPGGGDDYGATSHAQEGSWRSDRFRREVGLMA